MNKDGYMKRSTSGRPTHIRLAVCTLVYNQSTASLTPSPVNADIPSTSKLANRSALAAPPSSHSADLEVDRRRGRGLSKSGRESGEGPAAVPVFETCPFPYVELSVFPAASSGKEGWLEAGLPGLVPPPLPIASIPIHIIFLSLSLTPSPIPTPPARSPSSSAEDTDALCQASKDSRISETLRAEGESCLFARRRRGRFSSRGEFRTRSEGFSHRLVEGGVEV